MKGTQESGSAFRPAREASMMRKLVERHRGILPLDTVESIWRVIIATFTYVQAPYSRACRSRRWATRPCAIPRASISASRCRSCRIMSAAGAIAAVAASKGDLALVPAASVAGSGAWWTSLEGDKAPKIIARLPFVERPDHPASLPVFAVSHPAADAVAAEVEVHSLRVSGWGAAAARTLAPLAEVIAEPDGAFDGAALLVSVPQGSDAGRDHRGPGQGRCLGALAGPRRQPRDPLYALRPAATDAAR